jgi:cytochrome c oxidase subunit 4
MASHVVSLKIYVSIFVALLVMTALTIQVAFIDLGALNIYVAMTIAVIKATLVVLFFMHLRYSSSLTKLFFASGLVWLVILISLTVSDYLTRGWQNPPAGWVEAPATAPVEAGRPSSSAAH